MIRPFQIYHISSFQIFILTLLIIFTMLYITFLCLICFNYLSFFSLLPSCLVNISLFSVSDSFFVLFYVLLFHRFIILHCPQITANVLFTFHLFPPELKYWSNGKWGRGQAVRIVFGSAHKKHLSTLPE